MGLAEPEQLVSDAFLKDEDETPIPLRLISSETFKTGVLNLINGPAESTGDATYEDAKVHLTQPEQ